MSKNIVPGYNQFTLNEDGSITIPHGITNLQHQAIDAPLGSMLISGGVISEGTTGTVTISAMTALLRKGTGATDSLTYVTLAEQANQAIASADTKYHIGLDYNSGSPQLLIQEGSFNRTTQIGLGICMKDSRDPVSVHFQNAGMRHQDGVGKLQRRAASLRATELASGCTISDVGGGTQQFAIAAGVVYHGIHRLTPFSGDAFNSNDDGFTYVYRDGADSWNFTAGTIISHDYYYDGAYGLGTLIPNHYGCHWVYLHPDDEHIYVVYGVTNDKLAVAEAEPAPTDLPLEISDFAVLLGCIIIERDATAFTTIQMVTDYFFTGTAVSDHGSLGGLADDDHIQYILHSLADAENDFLVASAADTYVKKTLAETLAILAHTIASHSDTTATGANLNTLVGGGETALHSHAAAGVAVVTGSYAGNSANDRQITTGFKCSLVLVFHLTYPQHSRICMPNATIEIKAGAAKTDLLLHATDGFVVDQVDLNFSGETYYYWAIGE